jgi:hypothetical protein
VNTGPSEPHTSNAPAGAPHPRRPLRGIPTSRAYWELKAEQMMNRIFDPDSVMDLPVEEAEPPRRGLGGAGSSGAAPSRPAEAPRPVGTPAAPRRDLPVLLLASLAGVCLVSALGTAYTLTSWNRAQQTLQQERNLLLVERLRSLGPAVPAPTPAPPQLLAPSPLALQNPAQPGATLPGDDLPPPPDEPWIEELSQLPDPNRPGAPILRVPVSPRLAAAAPAAAGSSSASGGGPRPIPVRPAPAQRAAAPTPPPVLVGVVAAAGKASSAIFQMGDITTSVGVGEAIGTSGWRLRMAGGDMAEIEKDGEVRRVSISTGG